MSFFKAIGHFFENLFNQAAHAWHNLEPEVQKALLHGSGVIDIVNKNLDATPDFVWEIIQKKFPDITEDKLKEGLSKINADFKIAEENLSDDLPTLIGNLQKYLATLKGKFWEAASSTLAQILSAIFAPEQTVFAKIVMVVEFVYRKFIKE